MKVRRLPHVVVGFGLFLGCVGCGAGDDLMPLHEGKAWTYKVFNGYATAIDELKVNKPLSVAGVSGWQIEGSLGQHRMAWSGSDLLCERTPNARFVPPLLLAIQGSDKARRTWKGRFEAQGQVWQAEGSFEQAQDKVKIAARTYQTTKTRIVLRWPGHRTELISWFAPGTGLIKQEQRTDDQLDLGLELVSSR